jgi:hypothetical protein
MEMMEKGGVLDLSELVNARIKAFCLENNFIWLNQKTKFLGAIPPLGGKGQSAGVKVTLTFAALIQDEPYRSALGYGSSGVTSPENSPEGKE